MRHAFKDKKIDSQHYDITAQSRTLRKAGDLSDSSSDDNSDNTIHNIIRNENVNLNIFSRPKNKYEENKQNAPKKKVPLFYRPYHKPLENIYEEKQSANCSRGKKENQRYSSSFVANLTNRITIDKEFKHVVGNNSKIKTSSSVHEDEDITLCWIETTTIKENKTVRPLKRLVIREYTISFENSVTIPDNYLECKKFEGELTADDSEIGKTALFEIIDEDTKVSKVVNFTSISHVGDVLVWQHKKVKCGVGPVVTKNVIEWNDGENPKNPKKRVEIKISPKIKSIEEPCTESSAEDKKSSKPTDVTTESCENAESGTCEATTKSNDISKSSIEIISEEKTTESKETGGETEDNISTSITIQPSVLPSAEIFTTTILPTLLITKKDILSCEEDSSDPLCKQKNITQPSSSKEASIESGTTEEFIPISTEKESSTSSSEEEEELFVTTPENIVFSTPEIGITSSKTEKEEEKHLTPEEEATSIELSSEKLNTIDHVPSSSITSKETTQGVTITESPYRFTESVKEKERLSSVLNKLTEPSISTEGGITESFTEIKQTTSSSTTSNEIIDFSCENSEECASVRSPESCNESECGSEIVKSCESGICSTEETEESNTILPSTKNQSFVIDLSNKSTIEIHTTIATLSSQEVENYSTTIDNVVTRRSTTRRSMPHHKLTLKVKVVLEHIDEKEKKHNLVEVEKHLSFNENSAQRHSDLLEQLKFLNESVNRETLNALLNCTSLNSLTKRFDIRSNITQLNEAIGDNHKDLEFTNPSAGQDLISNQPTSEQENEDVQYSEDSSILDQDNDQENEVSSRRRKRRSLDDKIEDLGGFDIVRRNLIESEKLSITVSPCNASEYPSTKEAIHPSTTINNENIENETSNAVYIENERNIAKEENDSVAVFLRDTDNDTNLTTLEYQNVNATQESIELSTTTNNPEEETSDTVRTENGNDTTTEIILNTVPSIKENIGNETKIEVVRQTLPGIQEDVSVGLQHVVSEFTQNNLTFVNTNKTDQTNLPGIIADRKDDRIHSRIRRAVEEEVGYWSNERIREAPMGGNLRSFTEVTLYKIFS
ncbi:hypothetical protein EAG_09075 [Camponotus floridanus]|uniref:Uncharacterized protein n=2 Tax=Camponotus floridanus TaxID=104421 RepID=E2AH87_CAMFO|nr:hypothetical protein EAG_09075 [Camponotus floridanus]